MEVPDFSSPGRASRRANMDSIFTGRVICEERAASWRVTTGMSVLQRSMEGPDLKNATQAIWEMWRSGD
jgi:hypothetical protein